MSHKMCPGGRKGGQGGAALAKLHREGARLGSSLSQQYCTSLNPGLLPSCLSHVNCLQVLDENDNSPTFLPSAPNVTVAEDAPKGRKVAMVRATDLDSGE